MQALLYLCFLLFHIVPFLLVGYRPNPVNVTTILAIVAAFHLGVALGAGRNRHQTAPAWQYRVPRFSIEALLVAYLALRYESTFEMLRSLSEGRIQEAMLSAAVERYSGTAEVSALIQISTAVFFAIFALVGVEVALKPKLGRVAFLAGTVLILMAIQGSDLSRAAITLALLLSTCFFLFNARERLSKHGFVWSFKMLGGGVAAVAVVFVFAQYGRVFQEDNAWQIVGDRAYNLFLGGHFAFLSWLDSPQFGGHMFGSGMFGFVTKLFGNEFAQGNYEEIATPVGTTNIFLWYRGAIEDFGKLFLVYPVLCGYTSRALSARTPSRFEVLILLFGVQLILYPFYSTLYFTVFSLPFIALVILLPKRKPAAIPA